MTIDELLQHFDIGEDHEIEFKSAEGGLPKSIWETVSSFSNTNGGHIILGVAERKNRVEIIGVRNHQAFIKSFWDLHNNPQKLSVPVCTQTDVQVMPIEGHKVVIVRVPRANRMQLPVYINGNPMTGSYKRSFEGDYRCNTDEIKQMLRDASDTPQDLQVLDGFGLADLDPDTFEAFRRRFDSREPDHPFLALTDKELLQRLGGWRKDRSSGNEGLTIAGLLTFGRERSILDAFPHYHLDYQEQLSSDPDHRWTYRLTIDGTWEPNLFNFYYRVYSRLSASLDVPFRLDRHAVRSGKTHVHEALREALVNTLLHADHQSSRPIKVTKKADIFTFSNPGRLRIPLSRLYEGGLSDPRNPNLQKMFQMLGLGEKAGSGFQKILRVWKEQGWIEPMVTEQFDMEMTTVKLPMASLIPKGVEQELKEIVGDSYQTLSELDRMILVITHRFGEVSNADIQRYRKTEHPKVIGERLKILADMGCLLRSGHGRGSHYQLGRKQSLPLLAGSEHLSADSEHLSADSEHLSADSEHLSADSEHLSADSEHLSADSEHLNRLKEIAAIARDKKRIGKYLMTQIILELCSDEYLTLRTLSGLLNRSSDSIRNHYVNRMVKDGILVPRYPAQPNHPQQGYKTVMRSKNG
jgi:ATP-dependent DNA helicase RecG